MAVTGKINNEVSIMQALWRAAYRKGFHEIVLPTPSDARRIRFSLYNAMRPIRKGTMVDAELSAAADECSISIEGSTLRIQARSQTKAMSLVLESLGGSVEELLAPDPQTAEEAAISASQQRLIDLMNSNAASSVDAPAPRVTPYYTRER